MIRGQLSSAFGPCKNKMKRIEVHSHKPRVTAFLSAPNADKTKRYKVSVESLVVPAVESRILNVPLLAVKRRVLVPNVVGAFDEDDLKLSQQVDYDFSVFTPQNVRSLSHLAFQLNRFFNEFQLRITTSPLEQFDVVMHEYDRVGTEFEREIGADWYTLDKDTQISAVIRSDGRLGFKFGVDFQKLFILELSEEGQRIFGFKKYLAIDNNSRWYEDYIVGDEPAYNLPAEADLRTKLVFTESVFPFVDHRSELVVQCSLPLPTTGEGTESAGTFKRQLASYRFPEYQTQMDGGLNGSVLMRSLSEVREHSFELEKGLNTHNKFVMTGTDLQNFNLLLVHRVHTWKVDKFVQSESEYEMPPGSVFTLRLAVRQVR